MLGIVLEVCLKFPQAVQIPLSISCFICKAYGEEGERTFYGVRSESYLRFWGDIKNTQRDNYQKENHFCFLFCSSYCCHEIDLA